LHVCETETEIETEREGGREEQDKSVWRMLAHTHALTNTVLVDDFVLVHNTILVDNLKTPP